MLVQTNCNIYKHTVISRAIVVLFLLIATIDDQATATTETVTIGTEEALDKLATHIAQRESLMQAVAQVKYRVALNKARVFGAALVRQWLHR